MASVCDEVVGVGQMRSGRLFIQERRAFDDRLRRLDERWMLEVTVKRLHATRSPQANRYWWGVCLALASEHTGYQPEELHEIAKQLFIPKKLAICNGNGEVVGDYVMGGSTRAMNTDEFYEFVERFRQWCAETLDLVIPDPESYGLRRRT
jgi:hypothetical protein